VLGLPKNPEVDRDVLFREYARLITNDFQHGQFDGPLLSHAT
jgi:hypothetical protein